MPVTLAPAWRFRCLATARSVSVAGNGFGRVALAFGVLALPGSGPVAVSLVLACQTVPQVLLVLVGGALADRMSRSRLMMTSEAVAALAWAALAVVVACRVDALWLVCVLAAVAGAATALFTPAMTGIVPELVEADRLQRANAVIRIGQNSAMLVGLASSGVVVGLCGPDWAMGVNALSFAISGCLIAVIRVPDPERSGTSLWRDLRTGAHEFFARQWLWAVVAQFSVVNATAGAMLGVLGPLTAAAHFHGARGWSVVAASQALGTLAGAGLATRVRVRRPIRAAVLATFVIAVPMVLLGLTASVWLCAVSMVLAGVGIDVFSVLWSTTLQRQVPRHLLSRVSAYDVLGSISIAPLGLLVAGPLAIAIGTGDALLACAAVSVLATAAVLLSPQVRNLTDTVQPS